MLSPKMQRCVRVVDNQLLMLSDRARTDSTLTGNLHKKASDGGRWKSRYFVLYQVSEIVLFLPIMVNGIRLNLQSNMFSSQNLIINVIIYLKKIT